MKKIVTLLIALVLINILAGCNTPIDTPDDVETQGSVGSNEPIVSYKEEIIFSNSSYTVVKTKTEYIVKQNSDNAHVGLFDECQELRYIEKDGSILDSLVLIDTEIDTYRFAVLTDDNYKQLEEMFSTYSIHGDYLIADGKLYDGNLEQIGMTYGEVESVTSIEDGGIITFAKDNEVIHSYFHIKQVEEPIGRNVVAYRDEAYNHGINSTYSFLAVLYENYLKFGNKYFEIPSGTDLNEHSHICTENGTVVFLYFDENKVAVKNARAGKMMPAHDVNDSVYYHMVTYPIESVSGSKYFSRYDEYRCSYIPEVTWLVGSNSMFQAFYGTLESVCEGRYLLLNTLRTTGNEYQLLDRELAAVAAFNDDALTEDGKYHISFYETENSADLVSFWYDPQTKEAGIE